MTKKIAHPNIISTLGKKTCSHFKIRKIFTSKTESFLFFFVSFFLFGCWWDKNFQFYFFLSFVHLFLFVFYIRHRSSPHHFEFIAHFEFTFSKETLSHIYLTRSIWLPTHFSYWLPIHFSFIPLKIDFPFTSLLKTLSFNVSLILK